jgi:hypothetical protein
LEKVEMEVALMIFQILISVLEIVVVVEINK